MDADDDMVDGSECGSGGGDIDDPGGESGGRLCFRLCFCFARLILVTLVWFPHGGQ